MKAQRLKNIKHGIDNRRLNDALHKKEQAAANNDGGAGRGGSRRQERRGGINGSSDEEDEQSRQGNPHDGPSMSDDDADMNGITERNA